MAYDGIVTNIEIPDGKVLQIQDERFNPAAITKLEEMSFDYIVALDGSGDFTSLATCVSAAPTGSKILVKAGTYENQVVSCIGKNLTICGEDKNTTIIRNSYDDYNRPPIAIAQGLVSGITFASTGTGGSTPSYAAHIDYNELMNKSLIFKDCIFKSASTSAVGIGTRKNCELVFDNCQFISTSSTTDAFFAHPSGDANNYSLNQNLRLIDCRITSNSAIAMHLQKYGSSANALIITCIGCVLESTQLTKKDLIWISGTAAGVVVFNKGAGNNYSPLNTDTWAPAATINTGRYLDQVIRTYTVTGTVSAGVQGSFALPSDCATVVRMDGIFTSSSSHISYPLGNQVGGTSEYHCAYFVNNGGTKTGYVSASEACSYTINIEYVSDASTYI